MTTAHIDTLNDMGLRDYLAAHLMPAIYRDYWKDVDAGKYQVTDNWRYGLALDAYELADAMLKAREHKG